MRFRFYKEKITEIAASELINLNSSLSKLNHVHRYSDALQLFHRIHCSQRVKPDEYTLSTTLTTCANLRNISFGGQLHGNIIRTGFQDNPHVANNMLVFYARSEDLVSVKRVFEEIKVPDVYCWTTLLNACTKLGEVHYACSLIDQMPQRNEAVWNAIITACSQNGHFEIASDLFKKMHVLGVSHDNYSFASILALCSREVLDFGREVHSLVIKTGSFIRVSVTNALLTMYFNCGSVTGAYRVFEEAKQLVHDEVTYNAMIAGLVDMGRDEEAFTIFKEMQRVCIKPTESTFVSVMSSCSYETAAIQVHAQAIKIGLANRTFVSNAAISMYSTCRVFQAAHLVFNTMEEKDHVSWNSLIASYAEGNMGRAAILGYLEMQRQGIKPDEFTIGSLLASSESLVCVEMILAIIAKNGLLSRIEVSNSLISAFAKQGEVKQAYYIFCEMNPKNLISWNAMISGFQSNGWALNGLHQFSELLVSGLRPSVYTLTIVLSICASISALRYGKEIHAYILKFQYLPEPSIENALIALYAKCGVLDWSVRVFHFMVEKDIVSWNSMISAYAQHGKGKEAVHCFEGMQDLFERVIKPDKATFTAVLSACSHAGLIEDGLFIFNSMISKYALEPGVDHFSCIVDLLGRAGYLDAAENLMNNKRFNVDPSIWWTLFSSCAAHGNLRLGRIVARILLEAEEDNSAVYVLLSNILADAGHWQEAADVREMMNSYGVVKKPGWSWVRS